MHHAMTILKHTATMAVTLYLQTTLVLTFKVAFQEVVQPEVNSKGSLHASYCWTLHS